MITVSVVILPQDGGLEGARVYGTLPMMAHHHPPTPWWQVLQEKFSEFASETGTAGRERLAAVNQMGTARKSNHSILKKIYPEYSLEGLILKLKLQYFGHLIQRADSLEKTLMLGKFEGRRRRHDS